MTTTIPQKELRNNVAEVLRRAEAGMSKLGPNERFAWDWQRLGFRNRCQWMTEWLESGVG